MIIPKLSHDIYLLDFASTPISYHIIKHHPGVAATTQHPNPGQTQRNPRPPVTLWDCSANPRHCHRLATSANLAAIEVFIGKWWNSLMGKKNIEENYHWGYHSITGVIIPWGCHSNNKTPPLDPAAMNCFGEVQENRSHEGVQQLREEHDAQKASKKKKNGQIWQHTAAWITSSTAVSLVQQLCKTALYTMAYGSVSKPWYLVNPKIAGIYGCSSH